MAVTNTLAVQELSYLSNSSASAGYQILNGQLKSAVTNFEKTPQAQSDINYFESTLAKTTSVSQFVANPRLVSFVLSAFGLDSESNYTALVKQVLTQDPNSSSSLVNQLTDPRFKQLATALDFYDDGLSRVKATGSGTPTTATSAEGVTLSTPTAASTTSSASTASKLVASTTVNTNVTVGIGVQLASNQYFAVQEPSGGSTSIGIETSGDQYIPVQQPGVPTTNVNIQPPSGQYLQVEEANGSTGYTQGGTFSIGTGNQLALSDGSILQPPVTLPTDTTGVTVSSSGQISVTESGTSGASIVGQLQTATFTDPTQLSQDDNGYYTATTGSGSATVADSTGTVASYGVSAYVQSGTFTLNSSNQLALPDGTLLAPPVTFPAGTTSVNIDSSGNIDAYASAGATPTVVGTLQTTTFDGTSSLQQSGNYYTTASGTATPTPAAASSFQTYGATGYAQTGYFTTDSYGNLALADGSELYPPIAVPSDTTSLSIDTNGVVSAVEQGSTTPNAIGQLQVSTFSDPSQLSTDANGYSKPTTGSGSATTASISSLNTFGTTNQVQTTYTSVPAASNSAGTGAISTGIGVTGSNYLIIQKPDGSTAYTQAGVFSLNSGNQLALPDGSLLFPPVILPPDTSEVTVNSTGTIYAQEKGQTSPTNVGTLEVATFNKPAALSQDSSGYYTPTTASGAASDGPLTTTAYVFSNTIQTLVNDYVTNEFEVAVGANNSAVREALYFQRTISPEEATAGTSKATQADIVLGDSVLDDVAEVALGEPKQLAYQSIRSQEQIIESGIDLSQLQSPKYVAQFTARYLAESDASTGGVASSDTASTPNAALSILQSYTSGSSSSSSSGIASLFSTSA